MANGPNGSCLSMPRQEKAKGQADDRDGKVNVASTHRKQTFLSRHFTRDMAPEWVEGVAWAEEAWATVWEAEP